jgi:hypothetical protein
MKIKFSKAGLTAAVLVITGIIAFTVTSCVKKDFDNPPSTNVDPAISANRTIAQVKTLADPAGTIRLITDDITISGIINSDDRSGNIYKQIIFQDSSAGIAINVDLVNFYTLFPKGRKIFVKCKGLYIAYVKNVIQLGVLDNSGTQPALGRVPQSLVDQYILRGVWGQTVTPKIVPLGNLLAFNRAYENELVTINNVEFSPADTAKPFADALLQNSLARYIQDCGGNALEIYTSGYASFASTLTPVGSGSVTAVYITYNNTPELIIDKIEDVQMNHPRLGVGATVGTGALMSIGDLRMAFTSCGSVIASGTKIRGTVISDHINANINSNNIILQDATGGIIVRFLSANSLNLNDSVEINISGDSLVTFQQGVEVNYVPNANVTVLGTGSVTPSVVTASYVLTHLTDLESRLVKINAANLSGGTAGNYSGSVNVSDATGTVIMFTRSSATFASTPYPIGAVSVTGYISNFNGIPELIIRNTSDVQ